MITSVFVTVPCACGRGHRLPAGPDGVIGWLCGTTRKVNKLTIAPAAFQRALATVPAEQQLAAEGVCVVHQADAPRDFQQRCVDCGWLLVSYRMFLRRVGTSRVLAEANYWPAGALVGRSLDGSYYFAKAPMSPHRERRCFVPAGMA